MFSGIVETVGSVESLAPRDAGARLVVNAGSLCEGVRKGDSICVSGACLTAVEIGGAGISFDVNRETLDRTRFDRSGPAGR